MSASQFSRVEPLIETNKDALLSFCCGKTAIDEWLHHASWKDVQSGGCQVHICFSKEGFPVAFFTLSATSIMSVDVARSMQGGMSGQIPAVLLGKMGVSAAEHGRGFGSAALDEAKRYALKTSEYAGVRLLIVDAIDSSLIPWYQARGFKSLPRNDRRLVCKMSDIRRSLA